MKQKPPTSGGMHTGSRKRRRLLPFRRGDSELPSLQEVRRRIHSAPGFFSSLTPEAKAAMLEYDGPENLGPGSYDD